MTETRKQEEMAFHDRLYRGHSEQRWSIEGEARVAHDPLWSNFKYYAIEGHSLELSRRWLREYGAHAVALDYCCGNGDDAIYLAQHGAARVVGIDISPVSTQNCRARARTLQIGDHVSFETMDAEALTFDDNTFDLITEYGALHHLDLDKSMAELVRVMKPGGRFVGTETLGHNPFIRWYRNRTPELRTEWEAQHILRRSSFERMKHYFTTVEMHFFHLATLAAVPFRKTPVFRPLLAGLRGIDAALLRVPGLQWQAWQTVFMLSGPRKR